MPIYEFACQSCGGKFEKLCSMSCGGGGAECPECGGKETKRLISAFYSRSAGSCSCESGSCESDSRGCGSCSRTSCAGCH